MPNLRFEYHPEAVDEAIEAYNWYADRDERAADGFWEELRRARQTVSEQPEAWSAYLHGTRIFQLKRYPFGLVYIERGKRIIGIAVAHLKRKPGYWRKRLND